MNIPQIIGRWLADYMAPQYAALAGIGITLAGMLVLAALVVALFDRRTP